MLAIALPGAAEADGAATGAEADGVTTGAELDGRVAETPALAVLDLQAVFEADGAGITGAAVVVDLTLQAVFVEDATGEVITGARVVEGVIAGLSAMVVGRVAWVVVAIGRVVLPAEEEAGMETTADEEATAEVAAGLVAVTRVVGAGADPPDPAAQTATGPPGAT